MAFEALLLEKEPNLKMMSKQTEQCTIIPSQCGDWVKIIRFRQTGAPRKQPDVYLITPNGEKLRSNIELASYIRVHDLFAKLDPVKINLNVPDDEGRRVVLFNKLSGHTKKFIAWFNSNGTIPLIGKKAKEKPRLTLKIRKCHKCQGYQKIADNQNGICAQCQRGERSPMAFLNFEFRSRGKVFPAQREILENWCFQTGLSKDFITKWWFDSLKTNENDTSTLEDDNSNTKQKLDQNTSINEALNVKEEVLNEEDEEEEEDYIPDF